MQDRHIKSYMRRHSRGRNNDSSNYQRLAPHYLLEYRPEQQCLQAYFPQERQHLPLILDIGFGMAESTIQMARSLCDSNFVGIEVYRPGLVRLMKACEKYGLENVRVIHYDAALVIRNMISPASLDGVYLFFPDPWPKKRHHKRRFVQVQQLEQVVAVLKKNGMIYFATDWREYGEQALAVFSENTGLVNYYGDYAASQLWRPVTAFEKKGRTKGHQIYELLFYKKE